MKLQLLIASLLLLVSQAFAFVHDIRQGRRQDFLSSRPPAGADSIAGGFRHEISLCATKDYSKKASSSSAEAFKKSDFVAAIAERTGVKKNEAEASLQVVLDIIQEQVGQGKKITFPGFGSFALRNRSERKGRNPQTGEDLLIPASRSPSFTASKTWKDAINGK